jgi:hypothetical protein
MARRPIFIPLHAGSFVEERMLDFTWHAGFAVSQQQKSIRSLHAAADRLGIAPVLDISSKSTEELGVQLSAFNLLLKGKNGNMLSVECAFQGSKVFEHGGPYTDLYERTSREAKTDERIKSSGALLGFNFMDEEWPLQPVTAFYDWLYLSALEQNSELSEQVLRYQAFSDIAFNPEKSWKPAAFSQHTREFYKRDQYPKQDVMGYSIRTDRYRFTRWQRGPASKPEEVIATELYDYQKGSQEKVNLASDPAYAALVKEMTALLEKGGSAALPK